jgi:hypothetical protein
MAWCTPEEATAISRTPGVGAGDIVAAEADVSLFAGRAPGVTEGISDGDLAWLRLATGYQAGHLKLNPTTMYGSGHASQAHDGMSRSRSESWEDVLHPRAARALKNLSWLGDGLVTLAVPRRPSNRDFLLESSDQYHSWERL